MAPKHKDGDVILSFSGKWVAWAHTIVAYSAFLGALIVGVKLHYYKIVENEHYKYPKEWFPSVSATIGDRYPERSVFQLFIAITSGPRFALVFFYYLVTRRPNSLLPELVAGTGLFRSLTCGGWTYVTSTDDHGWHDIFMVSYLVATLPWMFGCFALSPPNPQAIKYRKMLSGLFLGTLVPLTYFFIQHKVHKVAGAYSIYALFEWAIILFDVGFDAVTALDFEGLELVVKDIKGTSRREALAIDRLLEKEKDKALGRTFGRGFSWDEAVDSAADVYNGYVFWSILTSLGLSVWYFPLWNMGLSGYEVLIMSSMSPFFLQIPQVRSLAVKNQRAVYLLSLTGLLAYLIPSPSFRLFTVAFAVFMSCISWVSTWYAYQAEPAQLEARICAWSIGLVLSTISKFAFWTNNPVWPIVHSANGGWNKLGFVLAVLAVVRTTRRRRQGVPSASADRKRAWPGLAALGLGGLFFGLHSLLSDSSTMILWVWEGYPVRGPLAAPHGAYTIIMMAVGLAAGLFYTDLAGSWTSYGVACVGAAILTTRANWLGYYGGAVLAAYLMAIIPTLIGSAVRQAGPWVFGVGFLVYNVMVLAHVWVVAYAFVPGGPIMREHTDWVMAAMMLLVGAGVFSASSLSAPSSKARSKKAFAPKRKYRSYYLYVLASLQLLAASIAYLRFPAYNYKPYHPDQKLFTAGIWTVHFSLDNDMWSSERRMRDVIKELEIDVIGLLESDLQRVIMGMRDTTQFLAEDLGMYVDYGPGPNKHTWGAALLSKFPILNSTHHLLPSPAGELAPAIHATLDVHGEMIDVVVFHSGQEEDIEDRRLQSEYLAKLMLASPRPLVLLSYLVTKPKEGNYNTYVGEKSGMRDIDPSDWDRWCEYILYKGLRRAGYARVSRSTITDTEIQVGKFIVGKPAGSDQIIKEDKVPAGQRFPELFKGLGVRGHQYHVFDGPR
ncbi:MAG: hypothetical protein M1815_005383 [Lichina confinis]|nr:MAG: hypothetical protein M1815_005383 [Lichina confinis]